MQAHKQLKTDKEIKRQADIEIKRVERRDGIGKGFNFKPNFCSICEKYTVLKLSYIPRKTLETVLMSEIYFFCV